MPLVHPKPFFPIGLNLEGRDCVVIGRRDDGEALEKAAALEECGAVVRRLQEPQFVRDEDIAGAFFVISTVKDDALSRRLRRLSMEHRFLLCCLDQPVFGFVSMMAIAKSGPVRLAISTSGTAPSISKAFRRALGLAMDPTFSRFVAELGALRRRLRERMPHSSQASQRVSEMLEAARGFDIEISFRYPAWFTTQEQFGCRLGLQDRAK